MQVDFRPVMPRPARPDAGGLSSAPSKDPAQAQPGPAPDAAYFVPDTGKQCWVGKAGFRDATSARWSGACVAGYADGEGSLAWFKDTEHLGTYTGALQRGLAHGSGTLTVASAAGWSAGDDPANGGHASDQDRTSGAGGFRYEGHFEAGRPHGKGMMRTQRGTTVEGSFEKGLPHGPGVEILSDGSRYQGEFRQGKKTGLGTKTLLGSDGKPARIENGPFVDGVLHGKGGKQVLPGDRELSGTFDRGELTEGTIRFDNGMLLAGRFRNQALHGSNGRFESTEGRVAEGEWNNGSLHGLGTVKHPDGSVHTGLFRNDQLHGERGKITSPGGDTWEGNFVEGRLHGKGTHKSTSGYAYTGDFVKGREEGQGRQSWKDGSYYEGTVRDGLRHGRGVFHAADGSVYDGEWAGGHKHGTGRMVYADGAIYDGEWRNDKRHGRGKLSYKSGAVYDGNFVDDQRDTSAALPRAASGQR